MLSFQASTDSQENLKSIQHPPQLKIKFKATTNQSLADMSKTLSRTKESFNNAQHTNAENAIAKDMSGKTNVSIYEVVKHKAD